MHYPPFYDAASMTSKAGQQLYMRSIRLRLIFLALAALGGAASWEYRGVDWFAWLALVSFLVALVAEVIILTARPDERWYEGRAAAESVKTLSWRFAVAGDPFSSSVDSIESRRRFLAQVHDVASDLQHVTAPPVSGNSDALPQRLLDARVGDFHSRRNMYMEGRLQDQIDWYGRNARKNEINQQRFLVMTIVLEFVGVLGAVLRITNVVNFDALGIIAAITAGAASWAQTRQYGQLGRAYSIAAHELSIIKAECAFVDAERWLLTGIHGEHDGGVDGEHVGA